MATSATTPRAGLPQWKAADKVKFITDVSKAFADADANFALSGDAFIPCTADYDSVTKRHTLTPTQANIKLPAIFAAQFIAAANFKANDNFYIKGAEYTPAYNDSAENVITGAWAATAPISVIFVTETKKAYIGAQYPHKAPLASPAFTGTATLGGKEIPTIESGTWTPKLICVNASLVEQSPLPTIDNLSVGGSYTRVGKTVTVAGNIGGKITNIGNGYAAIKGLPFSPKGECCLTIDRCYECLNIIVQPVSPRVTHNSNIVFRINNGSNLTNWKITSVSYDFGLSFSGSYEIL